MKKLIATLIALSLSGFLALNSYAASGDYDQDDEKKLLIRTTALQADNEVAGDFEFQASNNVTIEGLSSKTSFQHHAFHEQVENKINGRQFGMAADVNVILWLNISEDADGQPPSTNEAATVSTAFPRAQWNTL